MNAVTVVIVTRNRARVLQEALLAIDQQTRRPDRVVVVDDGSTDETRQVLLGFPHVDAIHTPPRGIAHARNVGWRACTTDVIAFTDDDCVPTPRWLDHLMRPLDDERADVVQGRTLPRSDQADRDGPWARTLRVETEQGFYQTANIAYRRKCLESAGGFDERLARVGEDTDLAWRVRGLGYRTAFEPEALVHHAVWPLPYFRHLRDRAKWADVVMVLRRHPHLRTLVHRRVWYRRSHERLALEAVLLLVAGRIHPGVGALVGAGVLARRSRTATRWTRQPHEQALLAMQAIIADGYETACFLRASVRHRTLLL